MSTRPRASARFQWNDRLERRLRALAANGMAIVDMAKAVGATEKAVRQKMADLNIQVTRVRLYEDSRRKDSEPAVRREEAGR